MKLGKGEFMLPILFFKWWKISQPTYNVHIINPNNKNKMWVKYNSIQEFFADISILVVNIIAIRGEYKNCVVNYWIENKVQLSDGKISVVLEKILY